jgi:uncharacterized membrane protein
MFNVFKPNPPRGRRGCSMDDSERVESLGYLFLAHHSHKNISHTILIQISGKSLRLCARCTGITLGFGLGLLFIRGLLGLFTSFPVLIAIFPLPGALDWLLQVFRVRESTTPRRIVTGALIGNLYAVLGVSLVEGSLLLLSYFLLFATTYFVSLFLLFKKTGALDRYVATAW